MTNPPNVQNFVSGKMNELFIEWLELDSTQKLIRRLIVLANGGPGGARISSPTLSSVSSRGSPTSAVVTLDDEVSAAPLPFFSGLNSGAVPLSPPASPRPILSPTSNVNRMNVPIPLRTPSSEMMSPPRSPSRGSPLVDLLQDEAFKLPKSSVGSPCMKPHPSPTSSVTPLGSALPSALDIAESTISKIRSTFIGKPTPLSTIPVFHTPSTSVLTSRTELCDEELRCIDELFASVSTYESGERVISSSNLLQDLLTTKLGLSRYFADPLFKRLTKTTPYITRLDFLNYWRSHFVLDDPVSNFFHVVKQDMNMYIARNDFRDFLWSLLDNHPGLSFLRESPEFQERYADTVICRIFYQYDFRHTGKIFMRDFHRRKSEHPSIIKSWIDLDTTDDINTIRQYFSYEHFYVLYCKFWDLDSDHDFLIDKDDLVKYDGHAFSPRAIERVFSETGFRFTSGIPGKMNYDDFVWFILSDEDKTSEMSLRFFFSLIDLDGDGVIRDHEMMFFYEDQVHRLECINQEAPQFADIMCQMNDLIRPKSAGQFRIEDFLNRRKHNAGVFFSILLSLNKFMAYEQRDPFQIKQDLINNPDLTDWDRFCVSEYVRLAMEAGSSGNNQQQAGGGGGTDQTEFLRNVDGGIVNLKFLFGVGLIADQKFSLAFMERDVRTDKAQEDEIEPFHPRSSSADSSVSFFGSSEVSIIPRKIQWVCDKAEKNLMDLIIGQSGLIPPHMMSKEVGKFLMWTKPVEGALFVFGGRSGRLGDARQYLKTVEYLDPITLKWNRAPDMKYARVGLAAAYMGGFYYVIGGYNQVNGDPQHSVEKLDVETLTWSTCSSLLIPRYGHSACACDGKIYVMGGDHQGVLVPFAERYDPIEDKWERIPDMPLRVAAARATCIEGKIFLFGGCDPSVPGDRASDAILVFDPQSMRWSVSSKRMRRGRTAFSLAAVGCKRKGVMIAGGFDLSTRPEIEMSSVEVIEDLMADGNDSVGCSVNRTRFPELPIPRAGCQGVSIPTNFLPVSFDKASPYPMIVLGGEYIDPVTGSCKVFDTATMLVTREFANRRTYKRDEELTNASCGGGIKFTAGRIIMNALKRRRGQFGFGTQGDEQDQDLVWSDGIIPPMTRKRTAFAACIGTAWPKGYGAVEGVQKHEAELDIADVHYRYRSRSIWPDLLHEWLQGNVL